MSQFLIMRARSRPGAIVEHKELHSIIPSHALPSEEQATMIYGPRALRPRTMAVRYARFVTTDGRIYNDDGQDYIFELTDRAPARMRNKAKPVAVLDDAADMVTFANFASADLSQAEARVSQWAAATAVSAATAAQTVDLLYHTVTSSFTSS